MDYVNLGAYAANFFNILSLVDEFIWRYAGLSIILITGTYFSFKSKFLQIRTLANALTHIRSLAQKSGSKEGVHPLKLYFASIGGMIGLGNLVVVAGTVTIGGPGSVFWMWMASLMGMMIKYSEIYLGVKYRIRTDHGYEGGPMHYLKIAFKNYPRLKIVLPNLFCLLFCIYGVEVGQFTIISNTLSDYYQIDKRLVVFFIIALVLFNSAGGVKRLANICFLLLTPFLLSYLAIGFWVIFQNWSAVPNLLALIFKSAFTGHAAIAGFAGSTIIQSAHQGVSRAVYSGDIGIGYDATVQSETQAKNPEDQAKMAIFALFSDTLICTWTVLIILLTQTWTMENFQLSDYLKYALAHYIPRADLYLSLMFFVAGFTTIIAYLVMGKKCAKFLHPKFGARIYTIYACLAFYTFSFFEQSQVMLVMSVSGGLLMLLNLIGVMMLRDEVHFPSEK